MPKKSLEFAVRQIANNLSPIAKNCNFIFWSFAKYHKKERLIILACALQCFLYLFCARLRCSKQVFQTET